MLPNLRQYISRQVAGIPMPHYVILPLIMALGFYLVFFPRLNYPYPLHLDEWIQMACSKELIREGNTISLSSPFLGGGPEFNQLVEIGFQMFWAVFHLVSGIPWIIIFRYFPGVIFLVTILSVYVMAQRQGVRAGGGFFTALIPTGVGTLGPVFMVPVAMGLLFIPLSLFVAFNFPGWRAYVVLFLFTLFLMLLHAATAVGLVIILIPFILLNLKSNARHAGGMALALVSPFIVTFPFIVSRVMPALSSLVTPSALPTFVDIPSVLPTFGYVPALLGLAGIFFLARKGGRDNYGIVLGLLLLVMLVAEFSLGLGLPIMYYRGLVIMMLLMSIVAGAGLFALLKLELPSKLVNFLKLPNVTKNVGIVLYPALIVVTLFAVIPVRQHALYYHMIDTGRLSGIRLDSG